MSFTSRLATVDDAAVIASLIDDMDAHYRGAGNTRGVAHATAMVRATLDAAEGTRFMLGFAGTEPVALACFALLRPGFRHQGVLFLKDLFVPAARRGRGHGRAMMAALAAYAVEHEIGRIDLTTDADNAAAAALYDSLGGLRQDKIMFRYDGDALAALAARSRV